MRESMRTVSDRACYLATEAAVSHLLVLETEERRRRAGGERGGLFSTCLGIPLPFSSAFVLFWLVCGLHAHPHI